MRIERINLTSDQTSDSIACGLLCPLPTPKKTCLVETLSLQMQILQRPSSDSSARRQAKDNVEQAHKTADSHQTSTAGICSTAETSENSE